VYTDSGKIRVRYISGSGKVRVWCISVLPVSNQPNGLRAPFLGLFFFVKIKNSGILEMILEMDKISFLFFNYSFKILNDYIIILLRVCLVGVKIIFVKNNFPILRSLAKKQEKNYFQRKMILPPYEGKYFPLKSYVS